MVLATSFQSIKKPSLCLLPIVKLLLNFILVDGASHSLRVSLFLQSENPLFWHFSSAFLASFFTLALLLCLSIPQPELHAVLQCQSHECYLHR